MYSKELIKGTLQPVILKLLAGQKRMYGYEITRKVKMLTEGKIEITEGALYPILHRLEADGVLQTETEFIGKRMRKYYSLTAKGNEVVEVRVNELADFLSTMSRLLNPKPTI